MTDYSIHIKSPYKYEKIESAKSCQIISNNDFLEILPEHTNINFFVTSGKINVLFESQEIVFEVFNASFNFDNDLSILNVYCLDFVHDKDLIISFAEIQKNIKRDSQSNFYLKFLENNEIVLERD